MSANGPTTFSVPGSRGDAAPGSLLAHLREQAARERADKTVTVDLPLYGDTPLRATYGTLPVDDLERYVATVNLATINQNLVQANLDVLARCCRSIEAQDPEGAWLVLEDEAGPVTFDDRLARLLQWRRPDDEFRYSTKQVYEGMCDGDGFAVLNHQAQVMQGLGLVEEELGVGESTSGGPMRSAPPPPSA